MVEAFQAYPETLCIDATYKLLRVEYHPAHANFLVVARGS